LGRCGAREGDQHANVRASAQRAASSADGTFGGLSVTTSVQGGEPGIITLNMHYTDFAPLDGPPPVAKTLGPQGTAAFLAKGAGLITQLDQRILRRVPDLSF
jgi:hypothetical protein